MGAVQRREEGAAPEPMAMSGPVPTYSVERSISGLETKAHTEGFSMGHRAWGRRDREPKGSQGKGTWIWVAASQDGGVKMEVMGAGSKRRNLVAVGRGSRRVKGRMERE